VVFVWDAVPPSGYAAMGCVVTTDENAPSLQSMVCVHMRALVTAPLGECLARSGEGSLWAVDNAAGSFVFSDEESAPLPYRFFVFLQLNDVQSIIHSGESSVWALMSGIVAWLKRFEQRWNGGMVVVWDAVPPQG
jgi:hypothetical protein